MTDEMIQLNFQTLQLEVQKMQTLVTQYAATFSDTDFMKNVPEYVTLKEAAKLKGVISYENLQKKPCSLYLQAAVSIHCKPDYLLVYLEQAE